MIDVDKKDKGTDDPIDKDMNDTIIDEAKQRFKRCEDYEGDSRKLFLEDVRFANADSDNGFQWPNKIRMNRDGEDRPCLTINKVRQHCLQIINDARQNKPSIKIRPTGDGATYEAAEVYEGVVRYIEYISNAQSAYDRATQFQVQGGIGYLRLVTGYENDDSFDQEIFIRGVKDPLAVYLDPDAQEPDKSDGRFGFVFEDMPKEVFKKAYPEHKDIANRTVLGQGTSWLTQDHIRVCEYYRAVEKKDKLVAVKRDDGGFEVTRLSKMPKEIQDRIIDNPANKVREIFETVIEWKLIAGDEIIDKNIWPGRYIPLIPVIGEETVIAGKLDRKGHVRNMKDPQRIYNYWTSAATEFVALQGKTPFILDIRQIEGYETYWRTANTANYAYLPYKSIDDDGIPISSAPPARAEPPKFAPAYIQGMQLARQEMMDVSGQYQSQMGEPGNEKSGKAINERQRQGDNATYHYVDNLAVAIRSVGKQIIDLIPKIYDTERVKQIMNIDGTEQSVVITPNSQQALMKKQKMDGMVERIFNPSVGKYSVVADVGPGYATQRQEAFNAFSQIISQRPELINTIGDLLFRFADFPGADKIAERLERLVPPQAKGEGPPPQVVELQTALQHLQGILKASQGQLMQEKQKNSEKSQEILVKVYDAVTKRIGVLHKDMVHPGDIASLIMDMMREQHTASLQAAQQSAQEALSTNTEKASAGEQAAA